MESASPLSLQSSETTSSWRSESLPASLVQRCSRYERKKSRSEKEGGKAEDHSEAESVVDRNCGGSTDVDLFLHQVSLNTVTGLQCKDDWYVQVAQHNYDPSAFLGSNKHALRSAFSWLIRLASFTSCWEVRGWVDMIQQSSNDVAVFQCLVRNHQVLEQETAVFRNFVQTMNGGVYSHVVNLLNGHVGALSDDMQRLSRAIAVLVAKRYMPVQAIKTPLYADLLVEPFNMYPHLFMMEAIMIWSCDWMVSIEDILAHLKDLKVYDAKVDCPKNLDDALLLWVCKIFQLMCVRLAAELSRLPPSTPLLLHSPQNLEDVIKLHYLVVALVEFYYPGIMQSYFGPEYTGIWSCWMTGMSDCHHPWHLLYAMRVLQEQGGDWHFLLPAMDGRKASDYQAYRKTFENYANAKVLLSLLFCHSTGRNPWQKLRPPAPSRASHTATRTKVGRLSEGLQVAGEGSPHPSPTNSSSSNSSSSSSSSSGTTDSEAKEQHVGATATAKRGSNVRCKKTGAERMISGSARKVRKFSAAKRGRTACAQNTTDIANHSPDLPDKAAADSTSSPTEPTPYRQERKVAVWETLPKDPADSAPADCDFDELVAIEDASVDDEWPPIPVTKSNSDTDSNEVSNESSSEDGYASEVVRPEPSADVGILVDSMTVLKQLEKEIETSSQAPARLPAYRGYAEIRVLSAASLFSARSRDSKAGFPFAELKGTLCLEQLARSKQHQTTSLKLRKEQLQLQLARWSKALVARIQGVQERVKSQEQLEQRMKAVMLKFSQDTSQYQSAQELQLQLWNKTETILSKQTLLSRKEELEKVTRTLSKRTLQLRKQHRRKEPVRPVRCAQAFFAPGATYFRPGTRIPGRKNGVSVSLMKHAGNLANDKSIDPYHLLRAILQKTKSQQEGLVPVNGDGSSAGNEAKADQRQAGEAQHSVSDGDSQRKCTHAAGRTAVDTPLLRKEAVAAVPTPRWWSDSKQSIRTPKPGHVTRESDVCTAERVKAPATGTAKTSAGSYHGGLERNEEPQARWADESKKTQPKPVARSRQNVPVLPEISPEQRQKSVPLWDHQPVRSESETFLSKDGLQLQLELRKRDIKLRAHAANADLLHSIEGSHFPQERLGQVLRLDMIEDGADNASPENLQSPGDGIDSGAGIPDELTYRVTHPLLKECVDEPVPETDQYYLAKTRLQHGQAAHIQPARMATKPPLAAARDLAPGKPSMEPPKVRVVQTESQTTDRSCDVTQHQMQEQDHLPAFKQHRHHQQQQQQQQQHRQPQQQQQQQLDQQQQRQSHEQQQQPDQHKLARGVMFVVPLNPTPLANVKHRVKSRQYAGEGGISMPLPGEKKNDDYAMLATPNRPGHQTLPPMGRKTRKPSQQEQQDTFNLQSFESTDVAGPDAPLGRLPVETGTPQRVTLPPLVAAHSNTTADMQVMSKVPDCRTKLNQRTALGVASTPENPDANPVPCGGGERGYSYAPPSDLITSGRWKTQPVGTHLKEILDNPAAWEATMVDGRPLSPAMRLPKRANTHAGTQMARQRIEDLMHVQQRMLVKQTQRNALELAKREADFNKTCSQLPGTVRAKLLEQLESPTAQQFVQQGNTVKLIPPKKTERRVADIADGRLPPAALPAPVPAARATPPEDKNVQGPQWWMHKGADRPRQTATTALGGSKQRTVEGRGAAKSAVTQKARLSATNVPKFSGAASYMDPIAKSNRQLVHNAIKYVCLAGEPNRSRRDNVLKELAVSRAQHFLILFRQVPGCQFRALYEVHSDWKIQRLLGHGPLTIQASVVDGLYKYNSGSKSFTIIPGQTLSAIVDAFTIPGHFWVRRPK